MSHFAQVVDKKVVNVIVAEQDVIDSGMFGTGWVQTSYNTRGNVHYGQDGQPDGGVPLRGNYAGLGYIYDQDAFYAPQPYHSWTLSKDFVWEAPTPMPTDGKMYNWDEAKLTWIAETV